MLSSADTDALPDDPDDLQAQLTAMAGPAAGPNGAQIFVGRLQRAVSCRPRARFAKFASIPNPFASEFDSPGFGRVQVFHANQVPDNFHASVFFIYGDHNLDTRNPFVIGAMPNYNNRQVSGTLSGALGKKLSWFLDLSQRNFNTAQLINAQTLGPAPTYAITTYNATYPTPSKNYQLQSASRLRDQLKQYAGDALFAEQRIERKWRWLWLPTCPVRSLMA